MAKYRKKPVVIEAFQYDGDLKDSNGNYYVPDWAVEAFENGILFYDEWDGIPAELFIQTLEGQHHASVDDYIIQGVNGELYPCKPDIFEKTYTSADETQPLFTLTAEEVENLQSLFDSLKISEKNDVIHLGLVFDTFIDYLLARIKQYHENNDTK